MSERPLLPITGIAEGLGAVTAGPFARAGYDVVGLARSERTAGSLAGEVGTGGGLYAHVIATSRTLRTLRQRLGRRPGGSRRMDAGAIANAYLQLVQQHPSAWTHEVDLRPFSERF